MAASGLVKPSGLLDDARCLTLAPGRGHADQALAPIRRPLALHPSQEGLGLRLHRLCQKPAGAVAQEGCERVVNRIGLTERHKAAAARQGACRLLQQVGQAFTRHETPPPSPRRHPGSDIAPWRGCRAGTLRPSAHQIRSTRLWLQTPPSACSRAVIRR